MPKMETLIFLFILQPHKNQIKSFATFFKNIALHLGWDVVRNHITFAASFIFIPFCQFILSFGHIQFFHLSFVLTRVHKHHSVVLFCSISMSAFKNTRSLIVVNLFIKQTKTTAENFREKNFCCSLFVLYSWMCGVYTDGRLGSVRVTKSYRTRYTLQSGMHIENLIIIKLSNYVRFCNRRDETRRESFHTRN